MEERTKIRILGIVCPSAFGLLAGIAIGVFLSYASSDKPVPFLLMFVLATTAVFLAIRSVRRWVAIVKEYDDEHGGR